MEKKYYVGPWSVEVVETLRTMWADQATSSAIAVGIWDKHKAVVTRNAVIGKIHRLGMSRPKLSTLAAMPKPARSNAGPLAQKINARKTESKIKPEPFVCQDAAGIVPLNLSLNDLTDATCKWPYGEAAPYLFCGHQTKITTPYCPSHLALAYPPRSPRTVPSVRRENLESRPLRFGGGRAA